MTTGWPGNRPEEGELVRGSGSAHDWKPPIQVAFCSRCRQRSYWYQPLAISPFGGREPWRMVWPARASGPAAHTDMPAAVREDYEEARAIAGQSPRAAAALLRLALEELCSMLLGKHVTPNDGIGELVRQGMSPEAQRAADSLRIIANEGAAHAGVMDLRDDLETVLKLFALLNYVVQDRITNPKMIAGIYEALPASKLEAIAKRDAPTEGPDPVAQAEEERRRRTPPPTGG